MATASSCPCVVEIGETAGLVWKVLSENGPMTVKKLEKAVGQPHDIVMQAIGWLAREDKISLEDKGRTRNISLR